MIDVRRNNHPAASHFIADNLGRQLLALRAVLHLLGDDALPGIVHLGKIAIAIFRLTARDPLFAGPSSASSIVAVSVLSAGRRHDNPRDRALRLNYTR